jgi:hypothetical protein
MARTASVIGSLPAFRSERRSASIANTQGGVGLTSTRRSVDDQAALMRRTTEVGDATNDPAGRVAVVPPCGCVACAAGRSCPVARARPPDRPGAEAPRHRGAGYGSGDRVAVGPTVFAASDTDRDAERHTASHAGAESRAAPGECRVAGGADHAAADDNGRSDPGCSGAPAPAGADPDIDSATVVNAGTVGRAGADRHRAVDDQSVSIAIAVADGERGSQPFSFGPAVNVAEPEHFSETFTIGIAQRVAEPIAEPIADATLPEP